MIGEDLPSWIFQQSLQIRNNRMYYIGYAEMSADKSQHYIAKAALMDAEVKLVSKAPTDIRIVTQNALTSAGIDSSEFTQIQTKLQELVGLTGVEPHQYTCRKFVRHGETITRIVTGCWHEASVNMSDLSRSIAMTLRRKYGDEKASKFDDLMKNELNKINNLDRFNKTEQAEVNNENNVNRSAANSQQ